MPGGVVSCAVLADGLAVCTATDGKVRAFDLARPASAAGSTTPRCRASPRRRSSDGVVYAGDLKGVIHAIDLKDGTAKWTLDLGTDPAVKAPGMIYGGPVVHGGRLYVATCNLEGPYARKPTVVVCIGDK